MRRRATLFGPPPTHCRICNTNYRSSREAEECEGLGEPWDPFARGTWLYDESGNEFLVVETAVHMLNGTHVRYYNLRINDGPGGNWYTVGQVEALHYS